MFGLKDWVFKKLSDWLTAERPPEGLPMYDFERMAYELRPGDALLAEGRTRVGSVIKTISESPWTHSALYIGRFHDIEDPALPIVQQDDQGHLTFYKRNPRLFAPRDFDYSPYFDIIKYPFVAVTAAAYKDLPWDEDGVYCNREGDCYTVASPARESDAAPMPTRINLLARLRRPAPEEAVASAPPALQPVPDQRQAGATDTGAITPTAVDATEPDISPANRFRSEGTIAGQQRDAA